MLWWKENKGLSVDVEVLGHSIGVGSRSKSVPETVLNECSFTSVNRITEVREGGKEGRQKKRGNL